MGFVKVANWILSTYWLRWAMHSVACIEIQHMRHETNQHFCILRINEIVSYIDETKNKTKMKKKKQKDRREEKNNTTQHNATTTAAGVCICFSRHCANTLRLINECEREANTKKTIFVWFSRSFDLLGFCFRFRCFCWIKFWILAWMRLVSVCCCAWQEERWQRKRSVYFKNKFFF